MFGATVTDIDLRDLDDATWEELHAGGSSTPC